MQSSSPQRFSLEEIKRSTNEFAVANTLGAGAYGTVYHGYICGKEVAMKRMNIKTEQRHPTFHKEIDLLSACDHVNVISLVGYCDEEGEKILVYEFMPKGSLFDYLYKDKNRTPRLTVDQRLEISIGVAKGLNYLHSGTHSIIIHSDLKADNILLEANLVPKIADFGLSRKRANGPSTSDVVTNHIKGTEGYIAPECYEPKYKLSRKADVYAFGVVLLEILCERPGWKRVVMLAIPYIMRGELEKYTPEYVETNISAECLRACENLIRDCLENDADKRPTMNQVVDRLELALKLHKENQDQEVDIGSQVSVSIPKALSSGMKDCVVLYHTSSAVVVDTLNLCKEVRQILDGHGKRVDERDVFLGSTYATQMKDIFGSPYSLPQVFIGGKYVGGVDEIRKLHWSGELRKKLERLPKRDYPSFCIACRNTRVASLSWCQTCSFWKTDTIWINEPKKYMPKS